MRRKMISYAKAAIAISILVLAIMSLSQLDRSTAYAESVRTSSDVAVAGPQSHFEDSSVKVGQVIAWFVLLIACAVTVGKDRASIAVTQANHTQAIAKLLEATTALAESDKETNVQVTKLAQSVAVMQQQVTGLAEQMSEAAKRRR